MRGIQNASVILTNVNSGPRDAASQFETHPSQLFAHEQRMLSPPDDEDQTQFLVLDLQNELQKVSTFKRFIILLHFLRTDQTWDK